MKINDTKPDKYGYELVEILSQRFNKIYDDYSKVITQKSYKGLAAKYKKDNMTFISIYFPNMKPSIINKRILKENLSKKSMLEVLAENIDNIYKMEDIELANISDEELESLLGLLPSNTPKDKNTINHVKSYILKARKKHINASYKISL